jgi:nicotinate-nucleotide pyrophosphorylase (carboxylating)
MSLPDYVTPEILRLFINAALEEDIGEGDHSSLASIAASRIASAKLLIKDEGILAGVELARQIFQQYDHGLEVQIFKNDGDVIRVGDVAFVVKGSARSILSTERLVLNCMQRMSGIATHTNNLVKLLQGTGTKLLDTRKTTPNFRIAEKWAVAIGGGTNHRFALFDMVMLKDNHIDAAGGVSSAIRSTRKYLAEIKKNLRIEIETRNLKEVEEVISVGGVDIVMLDNMTVEQMKKAVVMIGGKFKTEASGGITEENVRAVAESGVDYISMGALTHSPRSLDMSLKII